LEIFNQSRKILWKLIFTDEFMQIVPKPAKPGLEECRKTIQLLLEIASLSDRRAGKIIDVLLNSGYRTFIYRIIIPTLPRGKKI
jgi:hypothetical protein